VGWATGPANLVAAAQAAHQFVTFATATPMQLAVAHALDHLGDAYYEAFIEDYGEKRVFLLDALETAGLKPAPPQGTYFVLADFSGIHEGDDRAFVRSLIEDKGVAAIPPSVFYRAHPEEGQRLARFAFCKKMETLHAAAERLGTSS